MAKAALLVGQMGTPSAGKWIDTATVNYAKDASLQEASTKPAFEASTIHDITFVKLPTYPR